MRTQPNRTIKYQEVWPVLYKVDNLIILLAVIVITIYCEVTKKLQRRSSIFTVNPVKSLCLDWMDDKLYFVG